MILIAILNFLAQTRLYVKAVIILFGV
ncbi:uncharacterized protein METZ01_LOCUS29998 [marine metagenome]|uniref:Uncharacterized protein n=1 Tax=marine metagenome TaxID=408172 RepID=A0A381QE45_9ZZZZ